jgi:superfamily II DNA or RNA helicase
LSSFSFVVKDPDKAYLGSQLWLPKSHVNSRSIKASLEFEVRGDKGQEFLQLWEESPHHLAVPREYLLQEDYKTLSFPIIDLTPQDFPKASFKSNLILDYKEPTSDRQKNAFAAFATHDNGLLNLSCGVGKTCLALHKIAHEGRNALIIVNQTTILSQWEGSIDRFLSFDGRVGHIQGSPDKWDWKHPITIGMLHSLARHPDAVTPDMRRWFGVIIWDECHHLSAPYFCITATMFSGKRYGLTATAKREDGTEVIYNYHLGEVFHKDLMQTVKPTIVFRQTPFSIPPEVFLENVIDKRGNANISKLRTYVGTELPDRNEYQAREIRAALNTGRKVLALSHSKRQLNALYESFLSARFDCGICTGDQDVAERWRALRDKMLIFGTHQLVMEAIDEDSLDTLYWLSPFGSQHPDGGKNALQQGMGRIQGYRYHAGMKQPLVVIFDDVYISHFHRMCNKLRQQLRRWPADEGGPYEYKTLKPFEEGT